MFKFGPFIKSDYFKFIGFYSSGNQVQSKTNLSNITCYSCQIVHHSSYINGLYSPTNSNHTFCSSC